MAEPDSILDGRGARITAGLIALACAGLVLFLNWHVLFPPPKKKAAEDASLNPEFVACRDARLATVEQMKQDGVLTAEQFKQFSARAVDTCAGQFPPGG